MRYTEMLADLHAKANDINKAIAAIEPLAAAEKDGTGRVPAVPAQTIPQRPSAPITPIRRNAPRGKMTAERREAISKKMKQAWKRRRAAEKAVKGRRGSGKKVAKRRPIRRAKHQPTTLQVVKQGEQATREALSNEPQALPTT